MQNDLIERLEKCYTGAVYDVLRERGNKNTILPHEIKVSTQQKNWLEEYGLVAERLTKQLIKTHPC